MNNCIPQIDFPNNELVLAYEPESIERMELKSRLEDLSSQTIEIPLIIGGREVRTGQLGEIRCPHDRTRLLARFHMAGPEEVRLAIDAAREAREDWRRLDWTARAAIFERAAQLLAGPWRQTLNAATMLAQSKTVHEAEIDAACETIDFWRFNACWMARLYAEQPLSAPGRQSRAQYRPLEGFVLAVTPFNFTAIAANLPTAPAMMGNAVVWKPASTAVYSNWHLLKLCEEAGLPPGVINFVPGPGPVIGQSALTSPELAGLHFTGSTATFEWLWRTASENIERYRAYPRIVGETGGKGFVVAHPSADLDALTVALVRGAFEYQGQKCSAASRAYIPQSLWPELEERLRAAMADLRMGDVRDFRNFMGALIDRPAFERLKSAIELAGSTSDHRLLVAGELDASRGFFVGPTLVRALDPRARLMREELFGPLLTVFVYEDAALDEALRLCADTSPYALTGSIFARDRVAIESMVASLEDAAGNLYINDKPTGAVVGRQPFGGARKSGTNDKAGSMANLARWASTRVISETAVAPTQWGYSSMMAE